MLHVYTTKLGIHIISEKDNLCWCYPLSTGYAAEKCRVKGWLRSSVQGTAGPYAYYWTTIFSYCADKQSISGSQRCVFYLM